MVQGKYGNLDASVVSYGPCQTPTLNFCVEQHQLISTFQSEPFWSLRPHVAKHGQRYAADGSIHMCIGSWHSKLYADVHRSAFSWVWAWSQGISTAAACTVSCKRLCSALRQA